MHKDWAQREHPDLPALDVLKRYFFIGVRHLRGVESHQRVREDLEVSESHE